MEINGTKNTINQAPRSDNLPRAEELKSEAGRIEQQRREQELGTEATLASPREQLVAPSESTIQQIESSSSARAENNNASGLGEVAVNSYQSLEKSEQAQQLQDKIKVDITV